MTKLQLHRNVWVSIKLSVEINYESPIARNCFRLLVLQPWHLSPSMKQFGAVRGRDFLAAIYRERFSPVPANLCGRKKERREEKKIVDPLPSWEYVSFVPPWNGGARDVSCFLEAWRTATALVFPGRISTKPTNEIRESRPPWLGPFCPVGRGISKDFKNARTLNPAKISPRTTQGPGMPMIRDKLFCQKSSDVAHTREFLLHFLDTGTLFFPSMFWLFVFSTEENYPSVPIKFETAGLGPEREFTMLCIWS